MNQAIYKKWENQLQDTKLNAKAAQRSQFVMF